MLAATKRLLAIIMVSMVVIGAAGMCMVILGTTGTTGTTGIIDMVGTNGMCIVVILGNVVILGMVIVGTVIEQAMGMVIKLGIVGIVTHTVGMNTVGLLAASNNLTFCVIITDWSG